MTRMPWARLVLCCLCAAVMVQLSLARALTPLQPHIERSAAASQSEGERTETALVLQRRSTALCTRFPERCRRSERLRRTTTDVITHQVHYRSLVHSYASDIFQWRFNNSGDANCSSMFNNQSVAKFHCNGTSTRFFCASEGECMHACA